MDETRPWIIGLIVVAAILGLLLLARGEPDGGRRDATVPTSPLVVENRA